MKNKIQQLSVLGFMCVGQILFAQNTTTTTGGNATGAGGSVSYTVGQVAYTTKTATNGSVAEGVQQPYEISVVNGINESLAADFNLLVYPNPTSDFIVLTVDNVKYPNLNFQLFDINGKLIDSKQIKNSEIQIPMTELAAAAYFLKILNNTNKEITTFKIVKN